ncbi:MAG: hypothetical protein QMD14_06050 [Candidatus Aenigmarchaeota archaeon]|nr:hypothetical protein [Candidatus Aenigmarchaeota archaeon]
MYKARLSRVANGLRTTTYRIRFTREENENLYKTTPKAFVL